jgi:hypothetical protein
VVLAVEGAPLVFSTGFAHDLVLHLNDPGGGKAGSAEARDIPLTADAFHGGLVVATLPKRHALADPAGVAKVSLPTSPAVTDSPAAKPAIADGDAAPDADAFTGAELTGTIQGFWGFDPFSGPTMPLQETPGKDWKLAGDEPLIAGKDQHVLLASTGTGCIQSLALEPAPGKQEKAAWKPVDKPNQIDVTLDIPAREAGALHLAIRQFGDAKPASVSLVSYNLPARLDALYFHAGDTTANLTGTSLDQVREVQFGGHTFKPAGQGSATAQSNGKSELGLALPDGTATPKLPAGDSLTAQVVLKDGRTLSLPLTVEAARPTVSLIARADVPPDAPPRTQFHIKLGSPDDLPVSDGLVFSLKSAQPFPRAGAIEIASLDNSLHTKLSVADDSLILEDPQTLLATLQPLKSFGASAFGPIRLRAIAPDGTFGDWLPLVTLVRLPTLTELSCPVAAPAPPASLAKPSQTAVPAESSTGSVAPAAGSDSAVPAPASSPEKTAAAAAPVAPAPASCMLSGSGLYFVDSIATDAAFTDPTRVPAGFVGASIAVPPPTGAMYYLRLRDDPAHVDTILLPAGPL